MLWPSCCFLLVQLGLFDHPRSFQLQSSGASITAQTGLEEGPAQAADCDGGRAGSHCKHFSVAKHMLTTLDVDLVVLLLLMAEILHHMECMKPYKQWDKLPINWCRNSAINSMT